MIEFVEPFLVFSYEVNASNGEANTTHGWSSSSAVDAAIASGNKSNLNGYFVF